MTAAHWSAARLVGFDLETTGLDREVEEPVSYAFATFERGVLVDLDEGWIEPNRPISPGASAVHGLTLAKLSALGAVDHAAGLVAISKRLHEESTSGTPIVGANLTYDLTIVDRCLGRLPEMSSLGSIGWRGPALDVLVIDRALDKDFASRPVRKLESLCEHYGVMSEMHTAGGDATAAVRVLLAQERRFPELSSAAIEQLYDRQANWHGEWVDAFSARRVAQGRAALPASERAWPYLERLTLF